MGGHKDPKSEEWKMNNGNRVIMSQQERENIPFPWRLLTSPTQNFVDAYDDGDYICTASTIFLYCLN